VIKEDWWGSIMMLARFCETWSEPLELSCHLDAVDIFGSTGDFWRLPPEDLG